MMKFLGLYVSFVLFGLAIGLPTKVCTLLYEMIVFHIYFLDNFVRNECTENSSCLAVIQLISLINVDFLYWIAAWFSCIFESEEYLKKKEHRAKAIVCIVHVITETKKKCGHIFWTIVPPFRQYTYFLIEHNFILWFDNAARFFVYFSVFTVDQFSSWVKCRWHTHPHPTHIDRDINNRASIAGEKSFFFVLFELCIARHIQISRWTVH